MPPVVIDRFPGNILARTDSFVFDIEPSLNRALDNNILKDHDIDLVFLDIDGATLPELRVFITRVQENRPKLPIVLFSNETKTRDTYYLLREGARWHVTKKAEDIECLEDSIEKHVFSPGNTDEVFKEYAGNEIKPRIEPGLSAEDLKALNENREERYIIKRLFADSEVVQIFRIDEGLSGSRVYTVKPLYQLKRILKIEAADRLETARDKQERLIQPRLDRQIGQMHPKVVIARHTGGATYTLAGSHKETVTLEKFLRSPNQVRKELIDEFFEQLGASLAQLYVGSRDTELRYWASLFSRVLPPFLTLEDASLTPSKKGDTEFFLSLDDLTALSAVPVNEVLQKVCASVRSGEKPTLILNGFVLSELDTEKGILYLHDDLLARYPFAKELTAKDHPVLRFKVQLNEQERESLAHPVFRHGKRIHVRGRVVESQETILADNISQLAGKKYAVKSDFFELAGAGFMAPIKTIHHLLWEVGREDMISPIPQVSPVIHGDLNTSNILLEINEKSSAWLIDFTEARAGHIYFDLAKLEIEFRTHVFFHLFKELHEGEGWKKEDIIKFLLMMEEILFLFGDNFERFISALRDHQPKWYDEINHCFPLYFENLLYFLCRLRKLAKSYSPERFKYHYPVALFFHGITVLKFNNLNNKDWAPWPKLLALCCSLASGRQAIEGIEKSKKLSLIYEDLRARSAFAVITVGRGENRKFLLQWNANWEMFNLIGGKMDKAKDRGRYAKTIQRELKEELGIDLREYNIASEFKSLRMRQFSRRDRVFKDYVFHIFRVEFLPRHPMTREEYERFAEQHFSSERTNKLVSLLEIERLRTNNNEPISDTTQIILRKIGEIRTNSYDDTFIPLDFDWVSGRFEAHQGRAKLTGYLSNPPSAYLAEDILLEIQPSKMYHVEKRHVGIRIARLASGERKEVNFWLSPKQKQATVNIKATYYHDVRGREHELFFEKTVAFDFHDKKITIQNPYIVGIPLKGESESLFTGRGDIFSWIKESLAGKTQSHMLILHGECRMGKTSALYQLVHGKAGKSIREDRGVRIFPVFIDMQGTVGQDTKNFFAMFGNAIRSALKNRGIMLQPLLLYENPYGEFTAFLKNTVDSLPDNGLLVLILDEYEQLQENVETGTLSPKIFPFFRSLMQHSPRLSFILAGTHRPKDMSQNYWGILLNLVLPHEITTLSRKETEKLIREPVAGEAEYEREAVERIWLATRGHPYFIQLICHGIIREMNSQNSMDRMVQVNNVKRIIGELIKENQHLRYLWDNCSSGQKLVLSALAGLSESAREYIPRSLILSRLHPAGLFEDGINDALKKLETRHLIIYRSWDVKPKPGTDRQSSTVVKDYTYSISFDLLRQWISANHPLGSLLS